MTTMTTLRNTTAMGSSHPPIRTMQDLLEALPTLGYAPSTLAQIRPQVRFCETVYRQPLHRIPADLGAFEKRWGRGRVGAIAAGFRDHAHFVEWRRRVTQALGRAQAPAQPQPLRPDWVDLLDWVEGNSGPGRLLGPHREHGLRALGALASRGGLDPAAVTQPWIEEGTRAVIGKERRTVKRGIMTLAELVRDRDRWPEIAHLLPALEPGQPARVKRPPSPWRRGGPRPSAGLWSDFGAFVVAKRGVDELGRPVPPEESAFGIRTEETYATAVAQALALLERFGHVRPEEPLRLQDLCTVPRIQAVANAWTTRVIDGEVRGDAATRHGLVERLIHIATHHDWLSKKDRKDIAKLRKSVRKATPRRARMSKPREDWIRAFARDPAQQRALHRMPEHLMREAGKILARWRLNGRKRPGQRERMRALSLGLAAVMAAILFRGSPVRAANLRGLRFRGEGAHLLLDGASGMRLSIPAIETKNRRQIQADCDDDARPVIDWYLREIRPRLLGDHPYKSKSTRLVDSDFLFPSTRADQPLEETTLARHYALGVKEAGLDMTLHQARHVTAFLTLSEDPGALALAAEVLSDEIGTVEAHYAWMDGVRANIEARKLLKRARARTLGHKPRREDDD